MIVPLISRVHNHLNKNVNLVGNAIKCLAKVVSKIPETLVSEVCKKLITNINNPQKKEEIKNVDIYTTCLKTLINEIPEDFAEIMCKTLVNSGEYLNSPSLIFQRSYQENWLLWNQWRTYWNHQSSFKEILRFPL